MMLPDGREQKDWAAKRGEFPPGIRPEFCRSSGGHPDAGRRRQSRRFSTHCLSLYRAGMTYQQISDMYTLNASTVWSRVQSAMKEEVRL